MIMIMMMMIIIIIIIILINILYPANSMWICSNVRNKQIWYRLNITSFKESQLVGGWPVGYLHGVEELNSGPPKTNPSEWQRGGFPGPPNYKSSALPLGHARLPNLSTHLKIVMCCRFKRKHNLATQSTKLLKLALIAHDYCIINRRGSQTIQSIALKNFNSCI